MKKILLLALFAFLCTSAIAKTESSSIVIDKSKCNDDNICIGQSVLIYIERHDVGVLPYIGNVRSISKTGEVEVSNGASVRMAKKAFKEVECLDNVCAETEAVDAQGRNFRIRKVFSNKAVLADQGNPNHIKMLKTEELFNECDCIGEACKGKTVITSRGLVLRISGVFKNGVVLTRDGTSASELTSSLKDLGFNEKCSNEAPCSCSEDGSISNVKVSDKERNSVKERSTSVKTKKSSESSASQQ